MGFRLPWNGIRINRQEVSGAFGDLGTDLPLLIGMILASGMDAASVMILFGLMQIFSAFYYAIPMPVQPLKAVAAIVIAQGLSPELIFGGGLAIGIIMMLLSLSGGIKWMGKYIPKPVIRGIQMGLGMQLAYIAISKYIGFDLPWLSYLLAGLALILALVLINNRKIPPALPVIGLGIVMAIWAWNPDLQSLKTIQVQWALPRWQSLRWEHLFQGFLLLALPQIPLSLGNSIFATQQIAKDLFPHKELKVSKIAFTYSLMNLINPWLGGAPVCHGSGGMAGHYAFGGRTGGSVLIYGGIFLLAGLLFSSYVYGFLHYFPLAILGVILLIEALALVRLTRDVWSHSSQRFLTLLVGFCALLLPYGYLIGMLLGTLLWHLPILQKRFFKE